MQITKERRRAKIPWGDETFETSHKTLDLIFVLFSDLFTIDDPRVIVRCMILETADPQECEEDGKVYSSQDNLRLVPALIVEFETVDCEYCWVEKRCPYQLIIRDEEVSLLDSFGNRFSDSIDMIALDIGHILFH